jgi:hypothetical protein
MVHLPKAQSSTTTTIADKEKIVSAVYIDCTQEELVDFKGSQ